MFQQIGGYVQSEVGGIDSIAEISVRMKGWKVQTFPDLKVLHHRRVSTGEGTIYKALFKKGKMNYSIGYHPLFFIFLTIFFKSP